MTWARATVIRLRDHAERATARAVEAEARLADALERAKQAEAKAAAAEAARAEADRALKRRDHDLQAVLGKALLRVQRSADETESRANELIGQARAEALRARDEAGAVRDDAPDATEVPQRVTGLWATDDEDAVFGPMRALRAGGA